MSDTDNDEFPGGPTSIEFWSLVIPPGKTAFAKVSDLPNVMEIVHVTGCALGEEPGNKPHVVKVVPLSLAGKPRAEVALGTLRPGVCDQFAADFGFSTTMGFRHSGPSPVHLSGYLTRSFADDDDDDDEFGSDDEDEEDEDEEDDDEAPAAIPLAANGAAKASASSDSDEDEEDEDEEEEDELAVGGAVAMEADDDDDEEEEEDEDEDEEEDEDEQPPAKPAAAAAQPPGGKRRLQPQPLTPQPQQQQPAKRQKGDAGGKQAAPHSAPAKAPAAKTRAAAAAGGGGAAGAEQAFLAALVAELRKGPQDLGHLSGKVQRPSGMSAKYKAFLLAHPETFSVSGSTVSLK